MSQNSLNPVRSIALLMKLRACGQIAATFLGSTHNRSLTLRRDSKQRDSLGAGGRIGDDNAPCLLEIVGNPRTNTGQGHANASRYNKHIASAVVADVPFYAARHFAI